MKPLGLGEHGAVFYSVKGDGWQAMIYYRTYAGRKLRVKATGKTRAAARRRVMASVERALKLDGSSEFTTRSTLADGATAWLATVQDRVNLGTRSPSTLDIYRDTVERHIIGGVGGLKLGEVTTARLDRFLQAVRTEKGYATAKLCRTVLSGICGYLARQDALSSNPVRDTSPLEADRDRTARALTLEEVRAWLAVLDADPVAVRQDLPDLARFMLATGVRLGEALGVHWQDLDLNAGTVSIQRTVLRIKGQGLHASRLKSRASYRVLVLPTWCTELLQARQTRLEHGEGSPVFPDARGGYRDRSNVGRMFRQVRAGTEFEWVKTHTYRKTVATVLDGTGTTARLIADQLGHARISMTQDVYMGRKAVNNSVAEALTTLDPATPDHPGTDDSIPA